MLRYFLQLFDVYKIPGTRVGLGKILFKDQILIYSR